MDTIQRKSYGMAISGHNLLITGKPGTGKTFLICKIAEELNRMGRNVIATASTGVASASLREHLSGVTDVKVSTIDKFMGMRDGRFDNDELIHLLLFNENLQETKNRICQSDCLIIDEISLISKKTIEQIDFILRELKETNYCFGGIQVILGGDFIQLPCIPNPHYGDDGKPCYNFEKISCFHHVQLCDIHRQDEPDFIRAIHEIASGSLSQDSSFLIKRMGRSLPPGPEPLRIFAENLDVEIWNSEKLLETEGDIKTYVSEDSGDIKELHIIPSWKELVLKKECPVMLLVNLSDDLVNGLKGVIKETNEDSIRVYFPSIGRSELIRKHSFTVFCKRKQRDIASRLQIPLRLCFAATVHKTQGLTIDRVHIDCRKMHQPGQIAVAISRCKSKRGLRIVNFSTELIRKPEQDTQDFHMNIQNRPTENLACCRYLNVNCGKSSEPNVSHVFADKVMEPDSMHAPKFDDMEDEEMASVVNCLEEIENLSEFDYK